MFRRERGKCEMSEKERMYKYLRVEGTKKRLRGKYKRGISHQVKALHHKPIFSRF